MFLNLYLLKSLYKEHLENEKGALIPMQHFVIHFIIHSWICVILLSTTLSRVKKSSNVLIFISSIYILLYLLGYGQKLFTLTNNIIYILIYLFIIGYYIYVIKQIIYVFLTIFLYLLKCPQSLILSALRAFCFCGKPHISRSIFLYFRYQAWLKSW